MLQKRQLLLSLSIILTMSGCITPPPSNNETNIINGTSVTQHEELEITSEFDPISGGMSELSEQQIPPIPFDEFMGRWNAISDEYTLVNHIVSLEEIQDTTNSYYEALFESDALKMKIYTENEFIQTVQIIGQTEKALDHIALISAWWQLILITNSPSIIDEIDILLADLGVGPNADLTEVKDMTFNYSGVNYTISKQQDQFIFEATYP